MSFAVVIPARGGSRGIPRKNVKPFFGVPLVGLAVRQAMGATQAVYVTTEDSEIAVIARDEGAIVLNRPSHLATDTANGADVLVDACQRITEEVIVWHECTSPLTYAEDFTAAADLLTDSVDSVCAFSPTDLMLVTLNPLTGVGHNPFGYCPNRQERQQTYTYSGTAWAFRREAGIAAGKAMSGNVAPYIVPAERFVDLDSPHDWVKAEALARNLGDWIVVGSSPGVSEAHAISGRIPWAKVITTNAGYLSLARFPDVYFLSDPVACELHGHDAARMQASGTRLVTLRREPRAIRSRGLEGFDEFFSVSGPGQDPKFIPGKYAQCALSGLFCLQYALNHGARRIHLVGMEGYTETSHGLNMRRLYCGPFTQSCVDACPNVEFIVYGTLNYPLRGPNVRQGVLACQRAMIAA